MLCRTRTLLCAVRRVLEVAVAEQRFESLDAFSPIAVVCTKTGPPFFACHPCGRLFFAQCLIAQLVLRREESFVLWEPRSGKKNREGTHPFVSQIALLDDESSK